MAATESQVQGVSSFPAPPSAYYSRYTDANVEAGLAPKPPRPQRTYSAFGAAFDADEPMLRSLRSQEISQLYPDDSNRLVQMKKLNHSILVNFVDLLDVLIASPGSAMREQKIQDLRLLFVNLHHLVNEYRPGQAREGLRVMLEQQRLQRDQLLADVTKCVAKATSVLSQCADSLAAAAAASGGGAQSQKEDGTRKQTDSSAPMIVS
ncbi:mediator of RNA polymerase II transcription subunit 7-like [Oscarella lobularis]|uniref:mediator of RNA polymerase II transcription subunit 7-like n=1 Tax=Oscarella lobularis TaxID=121494 RepID=UPI003313C718